MANGKPPGYDTILYLTWLPRIMPKYFVPTKCRVVMFLFLLPEVIGKYRNKIQGLDKDLKEILKQEGEEKEVNKHACKQLSDH